MDRRTLLLAGGVTVSSALAGCVGDSGDGNGTGDGPDGDDPQPDEDGENAVDSDEQPAPQTLSGSGDGSEAVEIAGGLVVVESEHEGAGEFRVELNAPNGAVGQFADATGSYDGANAGMLEADTYTVEVVADGDWRVEVRQPRATIDEAAPLPQSLSGTGPEVSGPIAFEGSHTVAGTHDGSDWFQVRVCPLRGAGPEMAILEDGSYEGETSFSFEGVGWVDVDGDGAWTLELE